MNFADIRQQLADIDYAWTKPQTYLVFIPGLSLMIQKIQFANTLPLITNVTQHNVVQADAKSRKFANICKWHLRGSLIQIIATILAVKTFAVPLFSTLAIIATYELIDTFIRSLKNSVTFYEFFPNGSIKNQATFSACNIF